MWKKLNQKTSAKKFDQESTLKVTNDPEKFFPFSLKSKENPEHNFKGNLKYLKINSIEQAKKFLNQYINFWLNNDMNNLIKLRRKNINPQYNKN